MTGRGQPWNARLHAPNPQSRLAFYIRADELVSAQEGPEPPLWFGPVDAEHAAPAEQDYWARWNPILQILSETLHDSVAKSLDAIVKPGLVGRYDHPSVKPLFEELLDGRRGLLTEADQARLVLSENDRGKIRRAWAIAFYVKADFKLQNPAMTDNAINERVAEYLSYVRPPARMSKRDGTNRNHVRRAEKACLAWLLRRVNTTRNPDRRSLMIRAFDEFWSLRVSTIQGIEKAATKDERYRKLMGVDLANAIERDGGMHKAFIRVVELNERRRRA